MLALAKCDSEGLEMGLTPQERQQQNEMQSDIKAMLSRMAVMEDRIATLFSDKNRVLGILVSVFLLALAGLGGYVWAKITGH